MEWCFVNAYNLLHDGDDSMSTMTTRETFKFVTADYLVASRDPESVGIDP